MAIRKRCCHATNTPGCIHWECTRCAWQGVQLPGDTRPEHICAVLRTDPTLTIEFDVQSKVRS